MEDFIVPPAGTLFSEGSYTPSGSFPWMPDISPMLDEIWSEESFRRLSEEPLQANNREGIRLPSKVSFAEAFSFERPTRSLLTVLVAVGFLGQLHLLPEVRGHLRPSQGVVVAIRAGPDGWPEFGSIIRWAGPARCDTGLVRPI